MKNKKEKNHIENKLVLKVLPHELLISTTFHPEQYQTQSTLIRWKLSKKINPNDVNSDLEFISDNLDRMVKAYRLEGQTITTILPNAIAPLKTIDIPLDLTSSSDKKEYKLLTKNPYDFWKEHDDKLAEVKEAEIRAEFIKINDSDGSSKMLYASASSKTIKDYITMILGGNLYPVGFISEDQALIKATEARLTRVERERPFCIFHLSKNNSRLIYVDDGAVQIARVDISELDETLLDEIPDDQEDLDNEFWKEISLRLSTNLKQAFIFLKEELKASKVDTIFFVSDFAKESLMFKIFNKNFRLANFRTLSNQFINAIVEKPKAQNIFAKPESEEVKVQDYKLASEVISLAGCYKQKYFSIPSIENRIIQIPLFNFHPKVKFIESNFALNKYANFGIKGMSFTLLASLMLFIFAYINQGQKNISESMFASLDKQLKTKQQQISFETGASQKSKNEVVKINQAKTGNIHANLVHLINYDLPADLELERLIVRRGSFIIYGNGKTISEINRFYEKLLNNPKFKNLNFNAYRRADSKLNFFEIKGQVD